MESDYIKRQRIVEASCESEWKISKREVDELRPLGEPWNSIVLPSVEEFVDAYAFNLHVDVDKEFHPTPGEHKSWGAQ